MNFLNISGGSFFMGSDLQVGFPEDYEYPQRVISLKPFQICETTVTNQEFQKFIQDTGYITTATKQGYSLVFFKLLKEEVALNGAHVPRLPWWKIVRGADWAHPYGPDSDVSFLQEHPVVHVSLIDALMYCDWANATLPTEAQWEYAARGGTQTVYPWGDSLTEDNCYHANTWQGDFPNENLELDGYLGTAPVYCYRPNEWGLYQTIGNVWEWCRNPRYTLLDDFNEERFRIKEDELAGEYAIRGGSFLCHASYCNRYRVAARNGADYLSTSSHLSFRCIRE